MEKMEKERKVRRDKGTLLITKRDKIVLTWIGEMYAVRFDTLQKLLARHQWKDGQWERNDTEKISEGNTRRTIRRWTEMGMVGYQRFFVDEPGWVWLSAKGLRTMQFDYALWSPRQGTDFEHTHLINEIRLKFEDRYGSDITWRSERRLRKELAQLPMQEKNEYHMPDAEVGFQGKVWPVEVELTQKGITRLRTIIDKLREQYQGAWYFVSALAEEPVRRAVGESEWFKVYRIDEVLGG